MIDDFEAQTSKRGVCFCDMNLDELKVALTVGNSGHLTVWSKSLRQATTMQSCMGQCCWWKKSCTSWYVVCPIIYRVLHIPGGCLGFLPSTVWGKDPNAVFSCGIDFCQMFWQEFTSQADKTDSILKKALASQILAKGIRRILSWDMRLAQKPNTRDLKTILYWYKCIFIYIYR